MLCNGSESMPENKRFLNSNAIKLIAIIAMTIDHIAWAVYPGYSTEPAAIVMHIIGRLTCPIMCYCIAEGYHYTRDVKKYTRRLLIFALISHVPYMLQSSAFFEFGALALVPFATGGSVMGHLLNQTSVMWSLAIGLIMLRVNYSEKIKQQWKPVLILLLCIAAFPADWSCIASLFVFAIGTNRGKPLGQILWCLFFAGLYALVYCLSMSVTYGLIQFGVLLAIPVIALYNGQRGKNPTVNKIMKWVFYAYYPLHLLVIALVRIFA